MFMPKVASACTSNASASSVGAVYCPSGHQLWSSHPEAKSGAPFSCSVLAPAGGVGSRNEALLTTLVIPPPSPPKRESTAFK